MTRVPGEACSDRADGVERRDVPGPVEVEDERRRPVARRRLDGRLGVAGLRDDLESRRALEQPAPLGANARAVGGQHYGDGMLDHARHGPSLSVRGARLAHRATIGRDPGDRSSPAAGDRNVSRPGWHVPADGGPGALARRNVHVTADGRDAVVEVREPVAAVHVVDVESDPVVAYLEGDAPGVRPDADGHRGAGAGVLGRVLDRFQAAEVDGGLDRRRQATRRERSSTRTGSGERRATEVSAEARP